MRRCRSAMRTGSMQSGSSAPRTAATRSPSVQGTARATPSRRSNFGISLTTLDPGLVGCFQWAATDVLWIASAGPTGTFAASIPFPTTATLGTEVGAQAAWYDDTRPGLSASVSNGVVLRLGYTGTGNYCASAFFLGDAATSPWSVSFAQMPVLRLDY